MTELKYQALVNTIDPALRFEHHYAGYDVYRVTQGKTPRILKFTRKSPNYKCVGEVVRMEALALERALSVETVVDFVDFYEKGGYVALLRDFFDGELVRITCMGEIGEQVRETVLGLHGVGVANIDIQNFFRSRDGKTVKLIELGHAVLEGNPTYGEYRSIDLSRLRNYD
ncbi:hypothetical protein J4442_01755 [Candidatus Woesearchaeota archaeon]|nr:hypothetical protein [Candidatus Woesearchaeota archaeon]